MSRIASDLNQLAVSIDKLRLFDKNPRRGDVDAVARSLDAFGQRKPIVVKRDGTVIAGNHTLRAAQELGWSEIAVVWVDDDDQTANAFALADNRTGDLGSYDQEALALLIEEVQEADDLLLRAASYSTEDLDALRALLSGTSYLDGVELSDEEIAMAAARDAWPVISVQVPPDLFDRWLTVEADTDVQRIEALLGVFESVKPAA